MNKVKVVVMLLLAVLFSAALITHHAAAAEKVYQMTGKITAIDQSYGMVVIQGPMGGKTFTVGGPLSKKAVLKMKGKSVKLSDFAVGQTVNVRWKSTENGHLIESMQSK